MDDITDQTIALHQTRRTATIFKFAEFILAFVGSVISATVYIADRRNIDLPCSTGGGCSIIAASSYSHISLLMFHDIPVAALGFAGYVIALTLALWRLTNAEDFPSLPYIALIVLSVGGTVYSWYLQFIAHFVIEAFCVWCFASALTMTVLCLTTLAERSAHRNFTSTKE